VSTYSFRKTVATLIDDEGLSAIGADQLGHSRVSMTQDRGIAERLSDTDTCRPLDLFRKHPGEISQAVDQVGRPVNKSLDIERRQNLSDFLGCRQRAQNFRVGHRVLVGADVPHPFARDRYRR
jgi:hypothetical protein